MSSTESTQENGGQISLSDEESVSQVLVSTVFSLWEIVNNLTLVCYNASDVPGRGRQAAELTPNQAKERRKQKTKDTQLDELLKDLARVP